MHSMRRLAANGAVGGETYRPSTTNYPYRDTAMTEKYRRELKALLRVQWRALRLSNRESGE
jgi:hypothetical protein